MGSEMCIRDSTKAVLKLIAPYTRFSLQFISKHIRVSVPEVLDILSFLILDKKLNAKIDQDSGTVVVESASDVERLRAVGEWSSALRNLWQTTLNGEGLRANEPSQGSIFQSSLGDEAMRSGPRARKDGRGKMPGKWLF